MKYVPIVIILAVIVGIAGYVLPSHHESIVRKIEKPLKNEISDIQKQAVLHKKTPVAVRGIYMTSWVAGTSAMREKLVTLIDTTSVNSIVIDIKDDTGKVAFDIPSKKVVEENAIDSRVKDIKDFLKSLHEKDIYVIGRIAVFQDPHYAPRHPTTAVQFASTGTPWKDRKGQMWVDASDKTFWAYIADMARGAHAIGFDEIQFDYIRFPTDGAMSDIQYPLSGSKITQDPDNAKIAIIESFATYLSKELRDEFPISADIFGVAVTDNSDNGIGQYLENLLPHFDYISPMIYPSHFGNGYNGYANPAEHPYGVIYASMKRAKERRSAMMAMSTSTSTSNIKPLGLDMKLTLAHYRPWLQDFDIGADYNDTTVYEQIRALEDLGINSWLMWSPSNRYSEGALK